MWQGSRWWCCGPSWRGDSFPIALPPECPRYVMPGSHLLDPPYSNWLVGNPAFVGQFPFPRMPWAFESATRVGGTGLVRGPDPGQRWGWRCC